MSYCLNPHCQQPQNHKNAQVCSTCGSKLLLKQRYRAIKPIGQGGFGRTLLAVDEDKPSKPACVIKQLLMQAQGTNNSQKAAELFEQEAQRLDALGKHNQIPELFAYLSQEKSQYLVQQYIDGHNLAEILKEQGTFTEDQIWKLLNSLLPVLEYVHSNEVIHRDIKPENIIITRNKELYLVDFGAAKVVTDRAMLKTGTSIGTPEFVAPEQTRGKAIYSSDLYSLGTTCIYLLTGIYPFDLFDFSTNVWVWRQSLVDNPVSNELSNILDKLLENTISRRYQSVSEVLQDINYHKTNIFKKKEKINDTTSQQANSPIVTSQKKEKINDTTSQQVNLPIVTSQKKEKINYTTSQQVNSPIVTSQKKEKINDTTSQRVLKSPIVKPLNYSSWRYINNFTGHTGSIDSVAISPDGNILASGSHDSKIKLWDVTSDNKICTLKGHIGWFTSVNSLSFSSDSRIVSAGSDKIVKLWDLNTGSEIRNFTGHDAWVGSVAISPDRQIIASGSGDKTAILWDLNTGTRLHILNHTNMFAAVRSVAFSPDGQIIATASEDSTIKLWKVNTGQKICTFNGHSAGLRCVTFNPKKDIFASSSDDNEIKLWNINTKQEICTLEGHSAKVNSIVFSPDGQTLYSGSDDKTIKIWQCEEIK